MKTLNLNDEQITLLIDALRCQGRYGHLSDILQRENLRIWFKLRDLLKMDQGEEK